VSRFLVIGLDGMSIPLLELLIRRDLLAGVGDLVSSGFLCPLSSTTPPVTGPAWTTFATGVNPGKHGIYDFALPSNSLSKLVPVSSRDIRTKTFYEYLAEQGKRGVLINLPLSWPPLTAFPTLTSFLTRSENTVYPPGLADQIPILQQYQIAPSVRRPKRNEPMKEYVESVRKLERVKFQGASELLKKRGWDFFFILFGSTDWVSHLAYDQLIVGSISKDIANLYSDLDSYIMSLCQSVPDDTNVILMSDHGFRVTQIQFTINAWLAQEGYLSVKKNARGGNSQQKHALSPSEGGNAIDLTHLARLVNIPIVRPLAVTAYKFLRQAAGCFGHEFRFDVSLDPKRTTAACVSHESNGIYINRADRYQDGIVGIDGYETLRTELISKLSQITDPRTHVRVFKQVRKAEEVYYGKAVRFAPDILFELNDNYKLGLSYTRPNLFDRTIVNDHSNVGILIARGPAFGQGIEYTDARLMDLAPTILHCMGMPIPGNYDGTMLRDILHPDSVPYKTPVAYCKPDRGPESADLGSVLNSEEEALVLERLKGLGYLE
jgi:predicted AlkP superfamily phosphohydrolase/phosphomutase